MAFDYTYILLTDIDEHLDEFDNFLRIWKELADKITKGSRKRWTHKTYSYNIEFTFEKERHRDRFRERVDEMLIALRHSSDEVVRALLPKTNSRS